MVTTAVATTKFAAFAAADFSKPNAGAEISVGTPSKHPQFLFTQDKPWETRIDNGYPNAMRSANGEWRLFYGTCSPNCGQQLLLYANSSDGLRWEKPALGHFPIGLVRPDLKAIGTANNILAVGGGIGVIEDERATDPSRRFIAFGPGCFGFHSFHTCRMGFVANPSGVGWVPKEKDPLYPHADLAFSADGLVWPHGTSIPWPSPQRYDCHNNLTPEPAAASNASTRWLATTRDGFSGPTGRTIAIAASLDGDDVPTFNTHAAPNVTLAGTTDAQLYSQLTFRWHDVYLGLVMVYEATSPEGRVRCKLAFARPADVTRVGGWRWVDTSSVGGLGWQEMIPLGAPGSFDSHICFASKPVSLDGAERIYYMGGNGPHNGARNSSLGLATLRTDGFAGVQAWTGTGSFITVPLLVTGKTLTITADVAAEVGGAISIGVVDGGPAGLRPAHAAPVTSNSTDAAVIFQDEADFGKLVGSEMRLEVKLKRAMLYTIGFV